MVWEFLQEAARLNPMRHNRVRIVMGNEACDMDSAVSSIVYAYLQYCVAQMNPGIGKAIPVLNINQDDLQMKTDVLYFLKKCGVPVEDLVFRNTIDLNVLRALGTLELILVDHHTLSEEDVLLKPNVIEVIDHRPLDPDWNWDNINKKIEATASCATLIAEIALNQCVYKVPEEIAMLLYGTILLDTACLSENPKKYTAKDLLILEKLEKKIKENPGRAALYKELVAARNDISTLTLSQVLNKDMKMVCDVPICTIPLLIKDFFDLNGAENGLRSFAGSYQYKAVILLGVLCSEDSYMREIAVYAEDPDVLAVLTEALKGSKSPDLQLEMIKGHNVKNVIVLKQKNTEASRKQILPIVKQAVTSSPVFQNSSN